MNLNIIAYSIYLILSSIITIWVGRDLNKNGYHLILNLFEHKVFTKTINNMLLIGYYLINLGYIALTIIQFNSIQNWEMLTQIITYKIGIVLIILSLLHYNNIFILTILSKNKQKLTTFFN